MPITKKDIIIFIVILGFAASLTISSRGPGFFHNASNFTFSMGLLYIFVGLCVIIRNLGMFRGFAYGRYKRNFKKHGNAYHSAKPFTFGEFLAEKDKDKSPWKAYFIIGLPLTAISYLLTMV